MWVPEVEQLFICTELQNFVLRVDKYRYVHCDKENVFSDVSLHVLF